jgi:hypothetical protein
MAKNDGTHHKSEQKRAVKTQQRKVPHGKLFQMAPLYTGKKAPIAKEAQQERHQTKFTSTYLPSYESSVWVCYPRRVKR